MARKALVFEKLGRFDGRITGNQRQQCPRQEKRASSNNILAAAESLAIISLRHKKGSLHWCNVCAHTFKNDRAPELVHFGTERIYNYSAQCARVCVHFEGKFHSRTQSFITRARLF